MPTMKCNSCGGVYQSVQADGLSYFHACAPLPPTAEHPLGQARPNRRDENLVAVPGRYVREDGTEVEAREVIPDGRILHVKTEPKRPGLGASTGPTIPPPVDED